MYWISHMQKKVMCTIASIVVYHCKKKNEMGIPKTLEFMKYYSLHIVTTIKHVEYIYNP